MIKLSGKDSIVGKAIIVHEKVDDFKTQPTGNAGTRVACGVIEAVGKKK
jgi:Cu-Zn family superoxide dismutase